MRMRGVVGAALVVAVAVGCSGPVGGAGVPATATAAPPTSRPDAAPRTLGLPPVLLPPKVVLPARPRDVSVAGRDPCAVLTPALAERLGFDRPPEPNVFSLLNDAPGCTANENTFAEVLSVVFVTGLGGIDVYNRADVFAYDLEPLNVAGFPALLLRPRSVKTFCVVAVDIAPGEMVEIQVGEGGRKPTTPLDQLCSSAQRYAVAAIEAVLAG